MISIQSNVALFALNTFNVAARAAHFVTIESVAQLAQLIHTPAWRGNQRFVLGGGSNVLFVNDFDGLMLHIALKGRALIADQTDAWLIRVAAGENWDDIVRWTLAQGWPGLENLSLIPGTVGAAPIQNIGAYGVELADRFHSLEVFDTVHAGMLTMDAAACRFGYRDSIFKQPSTKNRYIITAVTLRLPKQWVPVLDYGDLRGETIAQATEQPTPQQIANTVSAIRRAKLPDPNLLGNAGSFFKNPLITAQQEQALRARFANIVSYAQPDGRFKLAAAWLIDQCGWKGKRWGEHDQAGVHDRQALVLVNYGGARGVDILALARAIQADVMQRFEVQLEIEPTVV